jgi:GxxExxY protein
MRSWGRRGQDTLGTARTAQSGFQGRELAKRYNPDLCVFENVVAELKAVQALTAEHEAQLFNYLRAAHIHVGYLLNFGSAGQLEWKRFIITDHKNSKAFQTK